MGVEGVELFEVLEFGEDVFGCVGVVEFIEWGDFCVESVNCLIGGSDEIGEKVGGVIVGKEYGLCVECVGGGGVIVV